MIIIMYDGKPLKSYNGSNYDFFISSLAMHNYFEPRSGQ